jgi:argininosuccinate lyase
MLWHTVYRDKVLMPDYAFAGKHLAYHLLDAMTAHVRTVGRLPDAWVQENRAKIGALEHALARLRQEAVPAYAPEVPDLYFAFNAWLEAELGPEAVSFLRLGLSRNDLDMTVYKMRTRELLLTLGGQLCGLRAEVLGKAEAHLDTLLIAHTHHQPGQPTTVAHYLAAIDGVLERDLERLLAAYGRLNTCPLGSAALAGSSYALDRAYTAGLLGFAAPVANSYDAVASSDWQVEFVSVVQSVALNLSRLVCDLISWTSQGLFELPDTLVQGSSIMPQKRNPIALEHARTRFSRALGGSQTVLYSSHNIPYGDLNDFGPDIQGAIMSLFIQFEGGVALLTACVAEGDFDRRRLAELARATDTTATELADWLTQRHKLSFQQAHRLVGLLVRELRTLGRTPQSATPEDLSALGGPALAVAEIQEALDPLAFVRRRSGLGGPAPEVVHKHIQQARHRLGETRDQLKELQAHLKEARAFLLMTPGKDTV